MPLKPYITGFGLQDQPKGDRIQGARPYQEDDFGIWRDRDGWLVMVVADGLGGHRGGAEASRASDGLETLSESEIERVCREKQRPHEVVKGLLAGVEAAEKPGQDNARGNRVPAPVAQHRVRWGTMTRALRGVWEARSRGKA